MDKDAKATHFKISCEIKNSRTNEVVTISSDFIENHQYFNTKIVMAGKVELIVAILNWRDDNCTCIEDKIWK